MASDKAKYDRALDKWLDLKERNAFSKPVNLGTTAVIYSGVISDSRLYQTRQKAKKIRFYMSERSFYKKEAEHIASRIESDGGLADIIDRPSRSMLVEVIEDPQYASIVLIGSGSLSAFKFRHIGDERNYFRWHDLADATTHLKLGTFVQRHCGHAGDNGGQVPLGAFAMSSFSSVYAPVGQIFSPRFLDDQREEDKIRQFTDQEYLTYRQLHYAYYFPPVAEVTEQKILDNQIAEE